MTRFERHRGYTLLELMVVVAIIGAAAALAIPSLSSSSSNERLRDAAIGISGALNYARSEAIRTGNVHLVFVGVDAEGNSLQDLNAQTVPVLILDDGRPGSLNQNCRIDGGENIRSVRQQAGVRPGIATSTTTSPEDLGTGDITTGSSFTDPGGNDASWVLFLPQGMPLSFDSACNLGSVGSGAGAFYVTNENRTSAVVLMPMGNTRVQAWKAIWSP